MEGDLERLLRIWDLYLVDDYWSDATPPWPVAGFTAEKRAGLLGQLQQRTATTPQPAAEVPCAVTGCTETAIEGEVWGKRVCSAHATEVALVDLPRQWVEANCRARPINPATGGGRDVSQRKNGKMDPQLIEALKASILSDLAKARPFIVKQRLKLSDGAIDPRAPQEGPVAMYLDWVDDPASPETIRPYAALRFGHPDSAEDFKRLKQPAVMCHSVQDLQVLLTCPPGA